MRHTYYSDYALRMLMYLAIHPDRLCTIEEIAASYQLSRNHLTKLAHQLGRNGFVRTVRGRSGGLALAMAPSDIVVGAVIRTTEEDFALVECFRRDDNLCVLTPACRLRGLFASALHAYLGVLDGCTIADLVAEPDALRRLLAPIVGPLPSAEAAQAAEAQSERISGVTEDSTMRSRPAHALRSARRSRRAPTL